LDKQEPCLLGCREDAGPCEAGNTCVTKPFVGVERPQRLRAGGGGRPRLRDNLL